MPKSRNILFGYMMKKGCFIPNPEEAETVVRIFSEYISGKRTKEIADSLEIPYSEHGKWYPTTISMLLSNQNYLGNEQYPALISEFTFQEAQKLKEKRTAENIGELSDIPEEWKFIRKMIFCCECGQRLFPRGKRIDSAKWGCYKLRCRRFDFELTTQSLSEEIVYILNAVIRDTSLLNTNTKPLLYSPNTEIIRQQNEIRRMTENPQTDCERIKSELLRLAEMKYNCCTYSDIPQKTEFLKKVLTDREQLHTLDIGLLKSCVKRMTVSHSAVIEIEFINGMKFSKSIERTESDEHST